MHIGYVCLALTIFMLITKLECFSNVKLRDLTGVSSR